MTVYRVQGPDGQVHRFEGPEGATPAQIEAAAEQHFGKGMNASMPQPNETGSEYILRRGFDVASDIKNAVTGRDRMTPDMQNMPEIGAMPGMGKDRFKQAIATATSQNDQEREIALGNIYPNAKFRSDAKGNRIVQPNTPDTGASEYAINKPGFSAQDWYGPVVQGLGFLGAGKFAAGAEGTPAITQAVRVGGGTGAASVGMDLAHNQAGGNKDAMTMGTNALLSAGLAGAFEAWAPQVSQMVNSIRSRLGNDVLDATGNLSPQAKELLRRSGVNPENLTPEFVNLFKQGASNANDPLHAFRAAESQTLPAPIRQTRGQITGDPVQQRLEEGLRRGSYGEDAKLKMLGLQTDQQNQIRANIPLIQDRLAGGQAQVFERGQGGEMVSNRINQIRADAEAPIKAEINSLPDMFNPGGRQLPYEGASGPIISGRLNAIRDAQKSAVDAKYAAAREADQALLGRPTPTAERAGTLGQQINNNTAFLTEKNAPARVEAGNFAKATAERIRTGVFQKGAFDPLSVPNTARIVNQFDEIAAGNKPPSISDLFNWRKRMSNTRAQGGEEAKAAGAAITEFDNALYEALDNDLLTGSEASIAKWKDAINSYRDFAQRFKGDDLVGKLTERNYATNSRELMVDPSSAANYILGRSNLGMVGKQNLIPDLRKLRDTLGADSPEWNALREEIYNRVSSGTPAEARATWGTALKADEPLFAQVLFSRGERARIDKAYADQAQFSAKFDGNDLVGQIAKRDADGNLRVEPESVANLILGRTKTGPAGRQNMVGQIKDLKGLLGENSPEWNAVREEVFLRFVDAGRGGMSSGEQMFSGANFKKNWQTAWLVNKPLMSSLFSQEEKSLIDQFGNVSARATNPVSGGTNPSGTSYAIFDLMKRIPFIGQRTSRWLLEGQGANEAARAASMPTKQIPPGYLGAIGATVGNQ